MRRLSQVLAVARKDVRLLLADRHAAFMCFAVPVLLAAVFGLMFDGRAARSGVARLPVLVAREADDAESLAIEHELLDSPRLEAAAATPADAADAVERNRVGVALVIPAPGDGRPTFKVLHHPRAALESQWAEGVLTEVLARRYARARLGPLADAALALPFDVARQTPRPNDGAAFRSYAHSFAGMTLQYLLFWGMESGLWLLRERNGPVWRRLAASPASLNTLLLGRGLSTLVVAIAQIVVTFGVGALVFGVRVTGSWAGFGAVALAAAALSAATGLFVAAVGGTEARARPISIVVILGASMLGGLWLPAFLLPDWARRVSDALPLSWAMGALDGLTRRGDGLTDVLPAAALVAGFSLVGALLAAGRFHALEARRRRG